MNKVIAIGGAPATGKSTVTKRVMERLKENCPQTTEEFFGLKAYRIGNVIVLGIYENNETFGGTDRYAMNIQPVAERAINQFRELEHVIQYSETEPYRYENMVLLFEGDRLFNESFLYYIKKFQDLELRTIVLTADKNTKHIRHGKRGDSQNKTWLTGREAKVYNIIQHNKFLNNCYNLIELENDVPTQLEKNVNFILHECGRIP